MIASLAIISATPPTPSASPLALSDVALHGDFADRQSRDRDVLLSLNATRWACHFTTTANLTSCKSAAVPWHTYVKNASAPTGFVHELGFLGAGDDLAPPATVLFPECEARCANAGACLGFCFDCGFILGLFKNFGFFGLWLFKQSRRQRYVGRQRTLDRIAQQ